MTTSMQDVGAANIEKALNQLWEKQRDNNQTKACLFNLVIYSLETRRAQYLENIIQTITEKFPCRIIFIQGIKSDPVPLKVQVQSVRIGKGDSNIVCDRINIEVPADKLKIIASIILPILVPDLPIYLIWGQDPTSDYITFPEVRKYATRLIFDAECNENLSIFSRKVIDMVETSKIEVMDLSWAAIAGWRDAIAQVFNCQENIMQLKRSSSIKIAYNNCKNETFQHTETQAMYLQAWIASSLNWNLTSYSRPHDGKITLEYASRIQDVQIDLSPEYLPELSPGEIASFEAVSHGNKFQLSREQGALKINVKIFAENICELPYRINVPDMRSSSTALVKEIFYQAVSPSYINALQKIAQIQSPGRNLPTLGA